ncbi:MAG TPA: fibronectin type III domain-containing protein [Candidatus Angelobacter sp.]
MVLLLLLAALPVSAQTLVNPTTDTIKFSGNTPNSLNTGPLGGIVMQGTAISVFTGQPVRHLWVADTRASICRMDPELDAPGPWDIALLSCQYSVFRGGGAIPVGGQFAYDPARHFLYFVDNNTASQGVVRIGFDPSGDSGHGALDLTNAFTLAGGSFARKGAFAGGTGCPYPGPAARRAKPNGAALSPLGDLWVGFADGGDILRFNSPATATETGFGTCDEFVQAVATSPDGAISNFLAWIGHDLWSGDGTSPFVIPNADTTCLIPPFPACSTANGTVIPTLAAVGATTALAGDQVYPNTNGNNLYYGAGSQIAWVGNVAAGPAGQTLTVTYINDPNPNPPLAAVSAVAVDANDPANVIVYSAEDPAIAVLPLIFGQARWWRTTQTSAAAAAPGAPGNVVAVASNAQISLSWNPAQVAQPVTSYTVHNSFISAGAPLADVLVTPAPGSPYPPTSLLIPGLTNGVSYAFQVAASNATGTSPFSAQSNIATPPGFGLPSAPTGVTAIAGDTQAFVTWTVSASNGGAPITSYTVNVLDNGVGTAIFVTVPPPAFGSNTQSALVGGLTNGDTYTFTVQATNIAGFGPASNLSNAVIPSAANVPVISITMTGPTSQAITPAQQTETITVTNSSHFPMSNITLTDTLSTVPALISLITRDATGLVTVSTTTNTQITFGQTVTIAGVADPSFNGTFTVTNTPTTSTFTYLQAGPVATSGGGSATQLPTANIVTVQTGQGTCTSGGTGISTFSCNIGFLDAGQFVRIPVIMQMQNQTITNAATVNGTDFAGTALAPKTASVTTSAPIGITTTATTDLQVSGSAVNGGPTVTGTLPTGAPDTYNWQIRNATSVPADNVVFTQTMPAALVFDSLTTDLPLDLGTCTGPAPGTPGGTVTCNVANLGGSRKGGAKPVSQFKLTVNVHVVQTGTISSTGTVTFAGNDSNPKNNTVTVTINAK